MNPLSMPMQPVVGTGLFLLTFVSEDAATLSGATLATTAMMGGEKLFLACFLGIWAGDLALFLLARQCGRPMLDRLGLGRKLAGGGAEGSAAWFERRGLWALALCRFVPGTRLPTFLTAGLLKMRVLTFAAVTGTMALGWVAAVFLVVRFFGAAAAMSLHTAHAALVGKVAAIAAGLALLTAPRWLPALRRSLFWRRWTQWEFWPMWLFYLPVGANYLWLSVKYRGLNTPACANPEMYTGGLIGESKYATLQDLQRTSPGWVAKSFFLADTSDRVATLTRLVETGELCIPFVLKPDVAQRGSGFKVARSLDDARAYLAVVDVPVVAQRYVPGPHEVGVFYYRFPHEATGRIFAMTEKKFPFVHGDGQRTLEELIRADRRAAIMARVYLARFAHARDRVPAASEAVRLVEAGNHAQGCIFQDGMHLWSEKLQARIDEISRALPGFYVGRYDLRYESAEALRDGRGFSILELNGAASEATSAYDARHSLLAAYRLLFAQWELVFAIGAANRRAGCRAESLRTLWREMCRYRQRSACHPVAD